MLYPRMYLENVTKINEEIIKKNNIKGIILDIDNTLVDYDKKLLDGAEEWAKKMKQNNIKLYILSNTNKVEKVKKVASLLDIPYIYFAKKPSKKGFLKIKEQMNINEANIAVVGDQIMTDVIGGNRCNMFTILTKPIDKRDIFITKVKRPLENIIIKRYEKIKINTKD
ncbi:MAG: YqeG family HAD IIIA-type phosphatase [Clostridia bacterium]|nr:YqeG family HAD IIIA-type phosphatase [Clostridia bacterium]